MRSAASPVAGSAVPVASSAPTADDLRHLSVLWASVLEIDPRSVSADDDFFALAADDSLLCRLVPLVNELHGIDLTEDRLRSATTLSAMAALMKITARRSFGMETMPVELCDGDADRVAVFFLGAMGATTVGWRRVVAALDLPAPAFASESTGFDGRGAPMHRVEDIARYRIAHLRELVGRRPVVLVGHSFGGTVAYEMGRQLLAEGHEVRGLVLLDTSARVRTKQERLTLARLPAIARRRFRAERKALRCRIEVRVRARDDVAAQTEDSRVRWVVESQRAANRTYRRRPYAGPMTIFRVSSIKRPGNPTLGWRRLVAGPIEAHEIAGPHSGLLNPDWAGTTAETLRGCLLRLTEQPAPATTLI